MILIALMAFQLLGITMTVDIIFDCSKLQFWNKDRRIEDKSCKNDTIYHCAWDLFSDMYKEICWQKRILIRKGQRPTIQGGLHFGLCPEKSYQPVPVVSNHTFGCWFLKSNCTDNGQVDCDHSSPGKDGTCRCDYTAGFAFVKDPKSSYFCIPSEEDCSCYKKICQNGEILNPDYRCVKSYKAVDYLNQTCLLTNISSGSTPKRDVIIITVDSITVSDAFTSSRKPGVAMLILIIILPFVLVAVIFVCPLCIVKSKTCENVVNEDDQTDIEFRILGTSRAQNVMWMHNNERIHQDSDEKYNIQQTDGTCTLTIHNVSKDDEGSYKCIATNAVGFKCIGNGKHVMRVFPRVGKQIIDETKKDIEQHKADKTYYRISSVDKALASLDSHSLLFIVGPEGIGKTKLCLECAKQFSEKGVTVFKFSSTDIKPPTDFISPDQKQLYIYDINMNIDQNSQICRDLVDKCKMYLDNDNIKIAISVLTKYRSNVLRDEIFLGGQFVFLESLTNGEKRAILENHMKHNNITTCDKAYESNYEDQSIVRKKDTTVKIYKQIVDSIVDTETLTGFPKACSKFCSDRSLLHLERRFFNTPPDSVIRDINSYRHGPNGICQEEYMVLVYILMNESLNLAEVKENMEVIYEVSKRIGVTNSPTYFKIKDAATKLTDSFLKSSGDVFTFYHPNLAKAVWMSYADIDTDFCIMQCDWSYIVDHVRPLSWQLSENEICIKVKPEDIVKRLTTELRRGYGSAWSIGQYLRKFSKCGMEVIKIFCKAQEEEKLDIDIYLNFCNGLSDLGTSFAPFEHCQESRQMLLKRNIDESCNCLLHYCVLQDYSEMIRQIPDDDFIEQYMMVKNKGGYSPCHLEFYFGRLRMIEKHLSHIPRKYEYYTLLNKLFHIGERKLGKSIEARDLNILGKMNFQSDSLVRAKFGSDVEYRTIRQHLIRIRNETISVIRLKEVPKETSDNEILSALKDCLNCTVLKQYTERHRQKGKITPLETGDRIAICNVLSEKDFLEKIMISSNEIYLELEHGDKKKQEPGHQKRLRSSS